MELVSQSEFAKKAKVSRQAISKALKKDTLRSVKQGNKTFIDLHDALSVRYLNDKNPSRIEAQVKKGIIKPKPEISDDPIEDNYESEFEDDLDFEETQDFHDQRSAILKLNQDKIRAQTAKIKIETANKLGLLISRIEVERAFDKLSAIIYNYLFPLGGRVAPTIAGIFENADPEKVNQIKTIIDSEMMRSIDSFKDASIDSIARFKKEKNS